MRGTICAIPVLNPIGFLRKIRYFCDGIDLNRAFPGEENGQKYLFNFLF
jgi:uncharacterized protein